MFCDKEYIVWCLLFLIAIPQVFAHGNEVQANEAARFSPENLKACLSLENGRDECYASLCGDISNYVCAEEILDAAVPAAGIEKAMMAAEDFTQNPDWGVSDKHLLAHIIGRSMAKNLGSTGEIFLQCPPDFNNGCIHGFFEVALIEVDDQVAATRAICERMPEETPFKEKWYCYHGAGHVFMMNNAYNLNSSIELCLSLNEPWPEPCWQGVFMENILKWSHKLESNFREGDPLYPCTIVDNRFKPQCYLNHYIYLTGNYSDSWNDLIEVCFYAGDFAEYCLASLAVYISNDYAAGTYDEEFGIADQSHTEKIVFLCSRFPEKYVESCHENVIAAILNDDSGDLARVSTLCGHVWESRKRACFGSIGLYLPNLVPDKEQRAEACSIVPTKYHEECMDMDRRDWKGRNEKDDTNVGKELAVHASGDGRKETVSSKFLFLKKRVHIFTQLFGLLLNILNTGEITGDRAELFTPGEDYARPGSKPVKAAANETRRPLTHEMDSEKLLYDDAFMDEAIQNYTLRSLTQSLNRLDNETGIDCHSRAHELGRRAYELLGGEAFKKCGIECHSGCRHGATEAFFADNGSTGLVENIKFLCEGETTPFGMHQCLHGVGHGLMAWFDYELPEALEACDLIESQVHRNSCHSGVFMENIVGGIVSTTPGENTEYHYTRWLNEDPHYPCNAVDDKYKGSCYFLQTDRMLDLLENVELIGFVCDEAPKQFQFLCFMSMGRTVSGFFEQDPVEVFRMCTAVKDTADREACLTGGFADQLWDETQVEGGIEFCRISENTSFEARCYESLIIRSSEVIPRSHRERFCKKIPENYYYRCTNQEPPEALPLSGKEWVFPGVKKSENAVIRYVNGAYVPDTVHVAVGSEVKWVSEDNAFWPASNLHPTHTAYPGSGITKCYTSQRETIFDACEALGRGVEYSFTFNSTGEWRFHDHINPKATGTIVVSN